MSHPRRHRASFDKSDKSTTSGSSIDHEAARVLLHTALQLYTDNDSTPLGLWFGLLQRCTDVSHQQVHELVTRTNDSGYTCLHNAIYRGDLCRILLLLRQASGTPQRLTRRPMDLLYHSSNGSTNTNSNDGTSKLWRDMTASVDNEGLTAAALLANLQRRELAACRATLQRILQPVEPDTSGRRSRSNSLFDELSDEQDEFGTLSRDLQRRQQSLERSNEDSATGHHSSQSKGKNSYGCEVFTFGRAHHCALGVVVSSRQKAISSDVNKSDQTKPQQHPQRVQAFAQDTVGRAGTAVAVASATYHTLTVTASGELYAFGLGKGGRLGTGDEKPCATPVRVMGPLSKQIVIGVAAAENHSLCVTAKGHVYAFGSNRFGQLGMSSNGSKVNSDDISSRCLPRRVNDLKQVFCTAVAAGACHSVALSNNGEVYVWGDNSAGQLGIYNRSGSDAAHHKPQRVEALWKTSHGPKIAIAIAASDVSTLVLTSASGQKGLANNMVYSWGNGNHVPSKAQFATGTSDRNVNPIGISCAKYHNVVVTAEGEVYSWGLHADSLGTSGRSGRNRSSSDADKSQATASNSSSLSSPQLVKGMLPENGGGRVVAASASENHTAVVTEDGHLWTWGDTFKQNVLGHEGVRWQPVPKRVQGVHRAVAVSAAKEHTVLLIGTSFPPFPPLPTETPASSGSSVPSLESIAARTIAQHCDLFNILPILITAERTQTTLLLDYCKEFVKLNCDGILNVGQKSAMDCYVNEQLDGCVLESATEDQHRDDRHSPFITDVVLAGSREKLAFGRERLCDVDAWRRACGELMKQKLVATVVKRCKKSARSAAAFAVSSTRHDKTSLDSSTLVKSRPRNDSFCPERCDELTTNMDLSSKDLAEGKLASLEKEIRGVRKRLSQIAKLETSKRSGSCLTEEQQLKTARRPHLESDLFKLDKALVTVKEAVRDFFLVEAKAELEACKEEESIETEEIETEEKEPVEEEPNDERCVAAPIAQMLRCNICQITCPDEKSHELHMNGRKHRNRMVQVAEEEQRLAAATMMEEQRRSMLLQSTTPTPKVVTGKPAWGKNDVTASVRPKYTLPPPPLPVADTLATPSVFHSPVSATKKSLLDIMAEESRRTPVLSKITPAPGKFLLQLPPGSAPSMKSPPWAQATTVKTVPITAPLSVPQNTTTLLLGDFIPPSSPKVVASTRSVTGWAKPKAQAPSTDVSFRHIQEQEMEFKAKEDPAFSPNGKWFIERRERAGSLKAIQCEAIKQSEEQRLIAEQIAIEKQIHQDLAAKKKPDEHQPKSSKSRSKPRKKNGSQTNGKKSESVSTPTQSRKAKQTKQQQTPVSPCDSIAR